MKNNHRILKGVIPVVQTLFDKSENIDEYSTKKHIKFLKSQKVGGLWVLGTGSEDMNLIFKKRIKSAEIITKENNSKLPLILGCSFFSIQEIKEFIVETGDLKFDSYHLMPYHPLLSLKRLTYLYENISDFTMSKFNKKLWLYSSANWSKKIDFNFIKNFKHNNNIAGIKYSTSNAPDQIKVLNLKDENFQVITAVVRQFISNLAAGALATTTSVAGAIPEAVNIIYKKFVNGKTKEALKYQIFLNNFLDTIPKNLKEDNFLGAAEEKYILSLRGIGQGKILDYYRSANKKEKKIIKKNILLLYKSLGLSRTFKVK